MLKIQDVCVFYIKLCLDHRLKAMRLKKGLPRLPSSKVVFKALLGTLDHTELQCKILEKENILKTPSNKY